MIGEWQTLAFSEAVEINPAVRLKFGEVYPFVDMQAVDPNSRTVLASELRPFSGGGAKFQPGDTLMARITPCLENGKIARFFSGDQQSLAHGSTEFIVIRGKEGITDNDFVYYLARSEIVRDYAISQMTGTSGRQRVPTEALAHLYVPIPPLKEQQTIAEILGALDDKIELNRRMNETLEAMARAIFKSWFVDFEPVRAKIDGRWRRGQSLPGLPANLYDLFPDSFEDSVLGKIPKDWRVMTLSDIAGVTSGKRPTDRHDIQTADFPVPVYGGGGVMAYTESALFTSPIVLTGRVGTLGLVFRICEPAWPSDNTLVTIPNRPDDLEFLFILMLRLDLHALNRGSTQPLLTQTDLGNQTILVPNSAVLDAFHIIVAPVFSLADSRRTQSSTLGAIRDALLPKLISGELRIGDAKVMVREAV